jgi:hypothetical protein
VSYFRTEITVDPKGWPSSISIRGQMIPSGHKLEGEEVSEIQNLIARVKDLSDSVDFWNLLMLWGLGLAAVAAVFVGIATRIVITRSGQLSIAQGLLSDAKDRQLQSDLKAKDGEIARIQKDANEAKLALTIELEKVASQLDPRVRFRIRFLYPLKGAPKAKAVIWFAPSDDSGAFLLALTIRNLLASSDPNGAGWDADEPMPIPPGRDPNLGDIGIVFSSKLPIVSERGTAHSALVSALANSMLIDITEGQNDALDVDTFLIVVKQRPKGDAAIPVAPIPFAPAKLE